MAPAKLDWGLATVDCSLAVVPSIGAVTDGPHHPSHHQASRGWLRGLFERLTRPNPSSPSSSDEPRGVPGEAPSRVAHYAITHKLGEGGMGVVYAARDERLERSIALKMISRTYDENARRRFWREARTAASVNHPNVCQIYEIGEDQGHLFIAMELLDGESLQKRLQHGAVDVGHAVGIGLEILAALGALHARGIIHRDLKPSNVFLTPHGVKLLDFGLARPETERVLDTQTALTGSGMVIGTPRYMAPEQIVGGGAVDARSDLFSLGTVLFEALSGRPAFGGKSVVEILHATVYEQPPALTGPPVVAAVDRVIRKALAKRPDDRPATAEQMARDLRSIRLDDSGAKSVVAQALTRLVILPFRVLRADPETDFLAFSLPDAIATSLSTLGSLILRSSAVGARFAGEAPDLKALAAEADVDRVVMGTLLRAGDQLRVSVQLVEAPVGTILASHTVESPLHDLFRLQDDLARRIADALAMPLVGTQTPSPDRPHDARAYEYYLRANELARSYEALPRARDLYQRCLDLDPDFAPAWAHLGRALRVIGKFVEVSPDSEVRAEDALKHALELNPRLAIAHRFYAQLEADMGQPRQALTRLLGQAQRQGNDPELFVGLVHVCRYCGLFDESLAAHDEARRLDPHARTSVAETLVLNGEFDRLLALDQSSLEGTDDGNRVIALGLAGRFDEMRKKLSAMRQKSTFGPAFYAYIDFLEAWLERRPEGMVLDKSALRGLKIQEDPEAMFNEGWLLCDVGAYERGLESLRRAIEKGYAVAPTLTGSRLFDGVRNHPEFQSIVARAEADREAARRAFDEAGGNRLLGLNLTAA